jgi:hypothetical protein
MALTLPKVDRAEAETAERLELLVEGEEAEE